MSRINIVAFLCTFLIGSICTTSAIKSLRVVAPLKALTIWDPETKEVEPATRRGKFLPIFKARLQAEAKARKELKTKNDQQLKDSAATKKNASWAQNSALADRRRRLTDEQFVEDASDMAAAEAALSPPKMKKNSNTYQFVGVVNPKVSGKPIRWYARSKPAGSKWSVRLVHIDQAAVVTDLFRRGKVDIFAKYKNTGKVDPETNAPVVESKYTVRERSVRNLWNFSPKHFFTDSSGMYWRERRLRPGLYTDGNNVYEASYRYRDGRNGMHRLSSFQQVLKSKGFSKKQKDNISKRLEADSPDIVLEE